MFGKISAEYFFNCSGDEDDLHLDLRTLSFRFVFNPPGPPKTRLAQHPYLLGEDLTVLDIAWFIYAHRLSLAGYPFARLHPRVDAFVQKLRATPEFAKEVATPPEFDAHLAATRKANLQAGKTLEMVAGF